MLVPLFILLLASVSGHGRVACPLKDGDLIFIKSQTSQAALLKISTGSDWSHVGMVFKRGRGFDVIEAVGPVKWTTLYSFLRASRNLQYAVLRPSFGFDATILRKFAERQLGKDYDLIFGWDDQRWYCSELVWKAYFYTTGEALGALERIKDLQVDDTRVIQEARRRFHHYGLAFDEHLWKQFEVITPIQMMRANNLLPVTDQHDLPSMESCLR
jgi:hypothetical protein